MKLVCESIEDVLKPKSQEEIEKHFKKTSGITFDEYKKLAKQLEILGVEIEEMWSWTINQMVIKTYNAYCQNWNIAKCAREKDALAIIAAHKQFTYEDDSYHISEDHAFLTVNKLKRLIIKLLTSAKYSTEFGSKQSSDLNYKHDIPEYKEWSNKNWDKISERMKKEYEEEKKSREDES